MKRFAKWLLGFFVLLVVLLGAGIFMLSGFFFQLEPWPSNTSIAIAPAIPERPNILLLVAEDLSPRIGASGDPVAQTPHIDQLASEGVRYPNTFTTAGVCAPSRAALILGMHQISTGGQHMRTATRPEGSYKSVPPAQVKAFPELLRAAGYYTFNTAKNDYQFSGALTGSGPFTIWDAENDQELWRSRPSDAPFFGMLNFGETHESAMFSSLGSRPNSATAPGHFQHPIW